MGIICNATALSKSDADTEGIIMQGMWVTKWNGRERGEGSYQGESEHIWY